VRCGFTSQPLCTFSLSPADSSPLAALDLGHLPGLSGWLEAGLAAALARLTEPRAPAAALAARLGDAAPKARLCVTIHSAEGLPALPGYDPFVRVALHGSARETGVRRRMVTPDWGSQAFRFTVWHYERARLRLDVLGWQARGPPAALGGALLDLLCLQANEGLAGDGTPLSLAVALAGGGALRITLQLWEEGQPELPAAQAEWRAGGLGGAVGGAQRSVDASQLPVRSQGETAVPLSELQQPAAPASAEEAEAEPEAALSAPASPSSPLPLPPPAPPQPPALPPPASPAQSPPRSPQPPPPSSPLGLAPLAPLEPPPPPPAGPLAEVQVTLHSAHQLPSDFLCDPYFRMRLGSAMADSGVRRRLYDPDYSSAPPRPRRFLQFTPRRPSASSAAGRLGCRPGDPLCGRARLAA